MTYYVMLAGRSPFEKLSSEFVVSKAIDAHDFPALGELDIDIPEPLVQIVMKAVEREPEDRYQSADEMLDAVQAWLASSSSEASTWSAPHTLPLSPVAEPIVGDKTLARLPAEPQPDIGATPQGTPPRRETTLIKRL